MLNSEVDCLDGWSPYLSECLLISALEMDSYAKVNETRSCEIREEIHKEWIRRKEQARLLHRFWIPAVWLANDQI